MKKLLLTLALMAGISASAQDNGNYRVISSIFAGKAVTHYIYVTAPGPQDSYVMTFSGGLTIGDATFAQGDLIRAQWIDNELQYAVVVGGPKTTPTLDARWDHQMQKGIKKLEKETL